MILLDLLTNNGMCDIIQRALTLIKKCCSEARLSINPAKTAIVTFTRKHKINMKDIGIGNIRKHKINMKYIRISIIVIEPILEILG